MGACYDVCFQLRYKNKLNAVCALNDFITTRFERSVLLESGNMSEAMSFILPQTCHWTFDEEQGKFYAAFDASYSWLTLLWDAFKAMSPSLQDASTLEIWPDNDYCRLTVKNGTLHFEGEGFWYS